MPNVGKMSKSCWKGGIDVWTTLNVQHIESLNDVIAQITGVVVRETLPDAVLERADEIELIDLTPEELMVRLQAGKVYLPSQAERALTNFFQKSNLVALRELSLRQAAHRLHQDVEAARRVRADVVPWATSERLLVCVGPSPSSAKLFAPPSAWQRHLMPSGWPWPSIPVATVKWLRPIRERTSRNLELAEQLGAETHTLIGRNVRPQCSIMHGRATSRKSLPAKRLNRGGSGFFCRTVVEELLEHSGEIDVYVITGDSGPSRLRNTGASRRAAGAPRSFAFIWPRRRLSRFAVCSAG